MNLKLDALPNLDGKSAIITGGAGGIGAVFVEALAKSGANVTAVDVNEGNLLDLRKRLAEDQLSITTHVADITDPVAVDEIASSLVDRTGRIDILVNSAALFLNIPMRPLWEIDPDEWDRVMAVNVKGAFLCIRAVAPHMIRQKSGKIINLSSGTWFKGLPGRLHYVTSKAAAVGMTRVAARELGPYNINVNALAPGRTEHPAFISAQGEDYFKTASDDRALKRVEVPEDLVGTLLYLSSSASDFVTGQTIVVDGGSYLH